MRHDDKRALARAKMIQAEMTALDITVSHTERIAAAKEASRIKAWLYYSDREYYVRNVIVMD